MTQRPFRQKLAIVALICFCQYTPHLYATQESPPESFLTFSDAVIKADAVIHGIVSSIDYRLSGRDADPERTPHVFVTYEIMNKIEGTVPLKFLTLRFVGGPDGRGGLQLDPSVPTFNVGDEDVLLISRNGEVACPLVGCLAGRLRIYGGDKVYGGNALPVVAVDSDRLHYGSTPEPAFLKVEFPSPTFDELSQNAYAMEQMLSLRPGADMSELRRLYESQRPSTNLVEYSFSPASEQENSGSLTSDDPAIEVIAPQSQARPQREKAIALPHLIRLLYDVTENAERDGARMPVSDLNPDTPFFVPSAGIPVAPPSDAD